MGVPNDSGNWTRLAARWALCVAVGLGVWLVPTPEGVSAAGWAVLAVFVATIAGFLLRPLRMGPLVLIALTFIGATGALSYKVVFVGYGQSVVWLVVAAFLIAGVVGQTGLGRRIALLLVHKFGRTPLGLGYAFCGAELVLAPVMPSNTARGGGTLAPIVRSVAEALGSRPGETSRRVGEYLVMTAAQANLITAAMFLTAMAANPLVVKAAADILPAGQEFGWGTWALGACVPGLLSLALLPLVIRLLAPPELRDTRAAQATAREELKAMGPLSRDEKIMACVFVCLLLLWATKGVHGIPTVIVAWMGVCALLLTRVLTWKQASGNAGAWDALVWLGGLVSLTMALKEEGVVAWFSASIGGHLEGMDGVWVAVVLAVVYFYSMYCFSMFTGHIMAFVAAFLGVAVGLGAPPMLIVGMLAYFGTLCGCTTHYSTGPVVIYFAFGYVSVPTWFRVGFVLSLVHMAVWLTVGMAWWKLLGWW